MVLEPGTVIAGRYQLERQLGQGGMGVVWSALHTLTRRRVALKVLKGPAHLQPELRRRFLREARAASAIAHPNVVDVHDVLELDDQTPVLVMDLLEGETLGQKLARDGALGLVDTAAILLPVVSAVGTAHAAGVVHRDLKPDNVFLGKARTGDRDVRVLDFGIAKLMTREGPAAETGVITGTGAMLGTPCYMSPEQAFGEKQVDHRADVWALGVLLYECLTGSRPVDGDSIGQVVKRLVTDAITPVEVLRADLPPEVASLIGRMLSRDASGRPADLREVMDVLRRYSTVRVPDFGAATDEPPEGAVSDSGTGHIVVAHGTADPSARTHDATPAGPETAGPHTVTAAGGEGVRRWGWIAALVLATVGFALWRRTPPAAPVQVGVASGAPVVPAVVAALEPQASSPVSPAPAESSPPARSSALPAPSALVERARSAAKIVAASRVAAPAPSVTPAPSAAPPRETPKRGGLAEKPPF